jgi:hypothetical protein
VDRKAANQQNCWQKPASKDKRPPNWKSNNSPEAALLTTLNDKYQCDYFHKDGHTEDRCYMNKREQDSAIVRRSNLTETALCIYKTALIVRAKESVM